MNLYKVNMSWIRWRPDKKGEDLEKGKRSEEVSDIIDRMPTTFGNRVAVAVVIFAILLFFSGWIIRYPDVVTGAIKINSNMAPVKLIANAQGKIHLNKKQTQAPVKEGEYIAVIQNPARTGDVVLVDSLLAVFDPNDPEEYLPGIKGLFPEKISLGELNLKYYTFLSALKSQCSYREGNVYDQQKESLKDDIRWRKIIREEIQSILETTTDNAEIAQKWMEKYSSLKEGLVATYEYEVDRSRSDYLSAKQNAQSLSRESASIGMQITESENRLLQLEIEKGERERQLSLDLLSSYHDLVDNIKLWESRYVLKSPFDGQLEFLNFWVDEQFVQAGEELFSIVPQETTVVGQMLLPAAGAGKVRLGDEVIVKLDNYPFREFGAIKGVVEYISLIASEQRSESSKVNTYLVQVSMPDGLTTNYGESLDFKYEIAGVGEIIVKKRRLIERLFDNLRFRTR
jgi:Multidrug resistance efflux pump